MYRVCAHFMFDLAHVLLKFICTLCFQWNWVGPYIAVIKDLISPSFLFYPALLGAASAQQHEIRTPAEQQRSPSITCWTAKPVLLRWNSVPWTSFSAWCPLESALVESSSDRSFSQNLPPVPSQSWPSRAGWTKLCPRILSSSPV